MTNGKNDPKALPAMDSKPAARESTITRDGRTALDKREKERERAKWWSFGESVVNWKYCRRIGSLGRLGRRKS